MHRPAHNAVSRLAQRRSAPMHNIGAVTAVMADALLKDTALPECRKSLLEDRKCGKSVLEDRKSLSQDHRTPQVTVWRPPNTANRSWKTTNHFPYTFPRPQNTANHWRRPNTANHFWNTTNQCRKTVNHFPKTTEHRKSLSEHSQTPQGTANHSYGDCMHAVVGLFFNGYCLHRPY